MANDSTINTVTGTTTPAELGRTLIHEHLATGWPGWECDSIDPGPSREEIISICVDQAQELVGLGITSMVDPCPNDLARDVELMATVMDKSGLQIICATGLYKEDQGATAYWKFRQQFGAGSDSIAEMYIDEIRDGVGDTGVKAGIIKCATGSGSITPYEHMLLEAAAKASVETGAPILTHTDEGSLGDEQQRILTELGVPAHRIVVGHSCGTADHDYHLRIAKGGSYLGFDRFGLDLLMPDEVRIDSMVKLIEAGALAQLLVSHDSVWCWRGRPFPEPALLEEARKTWNPTHFLTNIIPRLKDRGVSDDQISTLLDENPARFFAGTELAALT